LADADLRASAGAFAAIHADFDEASQVDTLAGALDALRGGSNGGCSGAP
jgi:hypothetical protein